MTATVPGVTEYGYAWNSQTGLTRGPTLNQCNELRMNKAGRYAILANINRTENTDQIWDLETNTYSPVYGDGSYQGRGGGGHFATLRNRAALTHVHGAAPYKH
jgi:hypothetical protein